MKAIDAFQDSTNQEETFYYTEKESAMRIHTFDKFK